MTTRGCRYVSMLPDEVLSSCEVAMIEDASETGLMSGTCTSCTRVESCHNTMYVRFLFRLDQRLIQHVVAAGRVGRLASPSCADCADQAAGCPRCPRSRRPARTTRTGSRSRSRAAYTPSRHLLPRRRPTPPSRSPRR